LERNLWRFPRYDFKVFFHFIKKIKKGVLLYVANNRSLGNLGGMGTIWKYGFYGFFGVGFGSPLLFSLPGFYLYSNQTWQKVDQKQKGQK